MSARFKTLPQLKGEQALASDPAVHAALSASAGTGKTQVLTARVLRLLLKGARPESILCLTFTKAAAAEMANRIGARLAAWVRLKDIELAADLEALGEDSGERMRDRARRLFAKVLDCPGGLKIQTIHSFAQSLLAAFPEEAGIAPGFRPIEGRAEQELVRLTLADLMADAEGTGDDSLIRDVQCLSRRLGEAGAIEYLQASSRRADALKEFGPRDTIEPAVRKLVGLPEGSVDEYLALSCADDGFDCDLLRAIASANRAWAAATGAKIVETIEAWLAMAPTARAAALPDLASIVFTAKGELKKVQKGQLSADPDYEHHAERLAAKVGDLLRVQRSARLAADIAAGLRAGQAFAKTYTQAKRAAGVADFNDLIEWTRHLLRQPGMGDWVRYKLDRQVDHVLVDEAQDTNAAQWQIVGDLVEEFFSGRSESEERHRTLFMVGDLKQAIYGFQGTDPKRFEEARKVFRTRAEDLSESDFPTEFRDLSIAASFRSAQPVLDVVNSVIDTVGHEALALDEAPPAHRAHHSDRQGMVELWHPFAVEQSPDDSDEGEERWVSVRDRHYATALADRIRQMVDDAPVLASTGRPLTPGDILVLVRSRGELASLIVARLFSAGVPVAGVDRLHLHEPLAVQDLLAAVKFVVQPHDDLSLACLLVSPLIGWDQDQLRDLAFGRKVSLWRELRRRAGESHLFGTAHEALSALLDMADFTTPSRFLETILTGPMQGRRKLYSRLGLAARDAIDELMNSALEFERNEIASLDRFLAWFSRGTVDVQRDPGQAGSEVRVMTVHGAKGLEAPVVILADATGDPAKLGRTPLTVDLDIAGIGTAPFLRPKKDERCSPFTEIIEAQETRDTQEHLRLLYVALTRAADHLIVSGVRPKEKKDGSDPRPANCWHLIVEQAMSAMGALLGDGHTALHHSGGEPAKARKAKAKVAQPRIEIPEWAELPAPVEARPPRPLAPSAILDDGQPAPPPSPAQVESGQRGTLLHSLFERLPGVEASHRHDAALAWLERSACASDLARRREIADAACRIIGNPSFADLFGPDSFAEAPLAATLSDGRVIAGTVDRLLVGEGKVRVIDFKTGNRVPSSAADVPRGHAAQMRAYAEALRVIFPGRTVEAALLYTAGPALIALEV
ncbi:double-strand break repair helicase AddA [Sphingomonas alba]|uniref:DNA 3'-5' helicase n=1 Tax=Sphingomonas alba TaxID=2908208 RepID=A0ABT0RJJ7_9SPHN|nr:double-strand break repair helicase AddA [Sphingomonas alba]MCL6682454.1 double-strand break repair helicase AddA [Sphingomonas alba]